jgi:hypothetical protein
LSKGWCESSEGYALTRSIRATAENVSPTECLQRLRGPGILAILHFASAACNAEPPSGESMTPDAGSCDRALALRSRTTPLVTFEQDIVPLFGLSCNFGDCHMGTARRGQLRLGPKCHLDSGTGKCVFESNEPTSATLDGVYQNLLDANVQGGKMRRVEPGSVSRSFLMLKLSGCQDESPDATGCTDCGEAMPPSLTLWEFSPDRYELLARWVSDGASRD